MPTDFRSVNRNDQIAMIAGAVAFIASFLPYWGVDYRGIGGGSITAWHSYAILGLLLVFAAAGLIAVMTFASENMPKLPAGVHVVAAAAAALGTFLLILRAFTYPHLHVQGASVGVKWGGYILFIASAAVAVFSFLGAREAGEAIPGMSSGGTAPPPPPAA